MNPAIVWIELGRKIPRHLIRNIKLHTEMFPSCRQILLTDQEYNFGGLRELTVVRMDLNEDFVNQLAFLKNNLKRMTGQYEFWVNTTSRFFALERYMKLSGSTEVIHLESDCVVLNMPEICKAFLKSDWGLGFPMQAPEIGCASILLVRNLSALSSFNQFVQSKWDLPDQDDMRLLGEFSTRKDVLVLPSHPSFGFIYDPQIYGRFLFGRDARNCRIPFSGRGFVDSRNLEVNPEVFSFHTDITRGIPVLQVSDGHTVGTLVNIHLHSKRVPKSLSKVRRLMQRDVGRKRGYFWKLGRLDVTVLLERVVSKIGRTFFEKLSDFRLR